MAKAILSGRHFPLYRQKNQEKVLTFFDLCGIIQLSSEEVTDMKILFIRRKKHVINDSLSPYAEQPVQHAKQPDE